MNLRTPITLPANRKLRVAFYARYSTDEQKKTSITDQFRFCEECLRGWGVTDAHIDKFSDEETSGELRNRPGINRLRERIDSRAWDLIVAEDSSRLFRNGSFCAELVESAVDCEIRVILPGDGVDTAESDWTDRLADAQRHHQRDNYFTRNRIKRTVNTLWEDGAAVGPLRIGYQRTASKLATIREPEEGPYYDSIDPETAAIVKEVYERVAQGDPIWLVADDLTERGLRKMKGEQSQEWTSNNVRALIRTTVYRGFEEFRKTTAKKIHRTGKTKTVRTPPDKVATRRIEHLRIVSDHLWNRANEAITARRTKDSQTDSPHPLAGKPRDSRGPLSGLFVCGVCGGKMYEDGRRGDSYRCGRTRTGECWNVTTAIRSFTHEELGRAIANCLCETPDFLDALVQRTESLYANDEPLRQQLQKLEAELKSLRSQQGRLASVIADGNSDIIALVDHARKLQNEAARIEAELTDLRDQLGRSRTPPSRDEILDTLHDVKRRVLTMDKEVVAVLPHLLDGKIKAMPYRRLNSRLVVLRAELRVKAPINFALDLLRESKFSGATELTSESDLLLVDLFPHDRQAAIAADAWRMKKEGRKGMEIARSFSLPKRNAYCAIELGRQMELRGVTDPFERLTTCPEDASRWRLRKYKGLKHAG